MFHETIKFLFIGKNDTKSPLTSLSLSKSNLGSFDQKALSATLNVGSSKVFPCVEAAKMTSVKAVNTFIYFK